MFGIFAPEYNHLSFRFFSTLVDSPSKPIYNSAYMGLRKRSPTKEWSPWDKAFWYSVGVLVFTTVTYGVYMYVEGITNPLGLVTRSACRSQS